ncbi:MAG: type II secretion system F family protein [Candidatus Bathyarchaeia archaeon]
MLIIYVYPKVKASARKTPIELNLTYILNFLTLLSSSNVSPRMIFRSMANIDALKSVRKEFRDIVRDVEIFGRDLLSSIIDNMDYTPSRNLKEVLTGYVATIRTGGDPAEYLRISTENAMKERMIKLDTMLESLSAIAEIYIMVLVAMPLLFVVMFTTLGMLGGGSSGTLALILYLLTYAFIPIAGAILIVVLSTFEVG